ncbi:MAG: helix-turn-helix domain-containing protein [Clostridia bacterium]|nr:helix-turn-helix domain-containing protein [Clostridia bacterium]
MNDMPKPTEQRYHLDRSYLQKPVRYKDISLIQIGRLHCTPHTVVEKHTHLNWFELTAITDGCGVIGTNGDSIRVRSGDIHLSFPGDFHEICTDTQTPLKCDFFSFFPEDPEILQEMEAIAQYRYPARKRLFSDERIVYQISNAIAELNDPAAHSTRILETIFLQIVLYLLDDLQREESLPLKRKIRHPEELCFQMMHYIDTHLYRMRSLSEIADSLNYSYSYLSELFRQSTGDTLQNYYRIRRLEAAKQLIGEGKLKIGEIAELLQYSSIYTFSRAFREQFGVSPTDLRKKK